jgi:GntR family transcriptional regulator, transcriptional repressor for pyruvate dehydrogenase complex
MAAETRPILQSSRLSRAEALAREIEEEVAAGILNTGDRLGTKDDLRLRFGVAVATVNEAIKLLDARGLVEARPGPGGGVFAASPASRRRGGPVIMASEWAGAGLDDYLEVRAALEPPIYGHAMRYRTEADIRALRAIVASMAAHLDNPRAWARHNTAFHRRVARLSPNVPLRSFYVTLLDFYEQDLVEAQGMPEVLTPAHAGVHQLLVDAIEARDPAVLAAAARNHDTSQLELGVFRPRPR